MARSVKHYTNASAWLAYIPFYLVSYYLTSVLIFIDASYYWTKAMTF